MSEVLFSSPGIEFSGGSEVCLIFLYFAERNQTFTRPYGDSVDFFMHK